VVWAAESAAGKVKESERMKGARIAVLTVALAAGGVAALMAGHKSSPVKSAKVDSSEILVAKTDIPTGKKISPQDLQWQAWPANAAGKNFVHKKSRPNAINQMSGLTVRVPFVAGEPIREAKLVNAKGAGFLAAVLPPGMRAVSTRISPETGAGGFILPNDHVDVILTRKDRGSETILRNVLVLAINQTVQEKNGEKVIIGKTATLELSPHGVETLAMAHQLGSLSLSLRSISDARNDADEDSEQGDRRDRVDFIRFGVKKGT
jgi:pilus assembly protein CpaB